MKKLCIIALVLWGCAQMVSAQNMYRSYYSPFFVPRPKSAVSVVHSNGYVYFFQADENGKLSATEINPLSMNPTGNAMYFQLTIPNTSYIIVKLNGGFEDVNGNIVLFGVLFYDNFIIPQYYQYPIYVRIAPNLSSCVVYCDQNSSTGEYTAGCDGYNQNMDEVYMFVHEQELVAVEATIPFNMHKLILNTITNPYDTYTDISWDEINNHFIATGFAANSPTGHEDPFVEVFDLLTNYTSVYSIAEYYICDPTFTHSSEHKSLHVQLDDSNLILYHDLERYDNSSVYDFIWLTRIKNFWDVNTAFVDESWFYELPNAKLFAKDMIYDSKNNRLNFLGEFNKCQEGKIQLLAQVDPYGLYSGIKIGQLGATFLGGTCSNDQLPFEDIAYNDMEMYNLALNNYNPCWPVLIAGVGDKKPILTETYDISLSTCDNLMWHEDKPAIPVLKPYSLNSFPLFYPSTPISINGNYDPITMNYLCDEFEACSHQFGGKTLQRSLTDSPIAEITIESGNSFVCDGFNGKIFYSLYDVTGKQIQQGIIQNGELSSLIVSNGLYFIQAKDAAGNQIVKKVVITEKK